VDDLPEGQQLVETGRRARASGAGLWWRFRHHSHPHARYMYPLLVAAGEQEENGPQAVRFGGPPKKSAGVRTVSQAAA
jgi:hypothetical protein